jgi:hypothetical protein
LLAGFIASKIINKRGEGVMMDVILGVFGPGRRLQQRQAARLELSSRDRSHADRLTGGDPGALESAVVAAFPVQ